MQLRCLIVDDNPAFLAAARKILEGRDLTVVGEASTFAEALERAEQLRPDLMLLDIDLGEASGFALARELAAGSRDNGGPKLILVSAHPESDFAELVAESPALGFVAKSDLSREAVADLLRKHGPAPGGDAQPESR